MKGRTTLIILALIGFITIGVLLITKIGNIGKIGASITYDANGCPKDGRKWTYDSKKDTCKADIGYTKTCADGYKWSSGLNKCYKAATRVNNNYQCFNGDTKLTNNRYLGNGTYCVRNQDKKVCNGNTVSNTGGCYIVQKAKAKQYTITYNANGGSATKNGKKYSSWSEKATYNSSYTTRNNWYVRKGYIFVGWNEKKNGTGVDWTGYINKNWKWTYKKNVTLYAQWQKGTSLIPDTNFNKCVIDSYNKEKGTKYTYSHVMTITELRNINTVNCVNKSGIKDIKGLEKMISLTCLDLALYNNGTSNIKKIDLSKNTNLQTFSVSSIPFTTLNISKNTKLINLGIFDAKISSLDLSKHTKLENLSLGNVPNIKTLDLTKNTALSRVNLNYLENLKTLTILSKKKSSLYGVDKGTKVIYK